VALRLDAREGQAPQGPQRAVTPPREVPMFSGRQEEITAMDIKIQYCVA
jgi:hypothetical protein